MWKSFEIPPRYDSILWLICTCTNLACTLWMTREMSSHAHAAKSKESHKWLRPQCAEGGQSCIQGQISSWARWEHCVISCLGWLAQSRKSSQGTKNSFHISHRPTLRAALLSFTGQSCRELTVKIQRWQLYSHIDKKLLLLQMVKSHFAPCVLRSLPLLLHVCPIWSNIWEESGFVWDGRRHVDFVFYGGFISNFMTI